MRRGEAGVGRGEAGVGRGGAEGEAVLPSASSALTARTGSGSLTFGVFALSQNEFISPPKKLE